MGKNRVLRNTISLYIRMFILTIISLFTVRVVLNVLGVEDYGTYNVVGGFVAMFAFISGTMEIATQRFFAYSLAKEDWNSVNKYFSTNLIIYGLIVALIILISETVGLWFLYHKMVIPEGRMNAALIVYEISILTFLIGLIVSPYRALLVADENLGIYSVISILEGVLKITVVYLLYIIAGDKLILYSIMMAISGVISNGAYILYCKKKYPQLKYIGIQSKDIFIEVFSFTNWNLIGAIAHVLKNQGINILLNIFYGPAINAARGIAIQVSTVVNSFSQNFLKALDPQIVKAKANGNKNSFFKMIFTASKISYFLLYIIILPLILNMDFVLSAWLGNVPKNTTIFAKLALIDAVVLTVSDPFGTGVQAVGKMKVYQIVVGGLALFNVPVAYIMLKIWNYPVVVFVVAIVISICMGVARVLVLNRLERFHILEYIKEVFCPILICTLISLFICYYFGSDARKFIFLVRNVLLSLLINIPLIYFIGMTRNERQIVNTILKSKVRK